MENDHISQCSGRRWGILSTLGFSLIIIIIYLLVQLVVAGIMVALQLRSNPNVETSILVASLGTNGLFFSLSTISASIVCMGTIIAFIRFRKGITIQHYLNLTPLSPALLVRCSGIIIIFAIAVDGIYFMLARPIVPDFMVAIYKTAHVYPLLWISVIIAAPVLEEVFFRGFLFEGLRDSKLGSTGSVLITSVIWAVIHTQYGLFEIILIALLGIILGIVKIKTQSLYATMAMHSLLNLIATLEVAILFHGTSRMLFIIDFSRNINNICAYSVC
ncbi:MAG: type II CAAX endopeptidase family protein [Thermodesulfobacteriota bacterium]|nr:type II CAAX endopeptidase family protein [Thermodesulfobacteriota bacterium]